MQLTKMYWAVADARPWNNPGDYEVRLLNWDPKGMEGYTLVREQPYAVTIDIPGDFDIRESQAESLREQIKQVKAEAQSKITELTAMLNSILAIEG